MQTGDIRTHCSHPQHPLRKRQYSSLSFRSCDICGKGVAGLVGYRCSACDFNIHEACADRYGETISFFAHPEHTLELGLTGVDHSCGLCMETFPPGSVVYRCVQCGFDVHPLCTMIPQTIRSPLMHPEHDLNMVPSAGRCSACGERCFGWFYRCGICRVHVDLHRECLSGSSSTTKSSTGKRVAKYLLKTAYEIAYEIAVDSASDAMGSAILEVLEEAGGED